MPNVEVSGIEYYFCIHDMQKITKVRDIEVEFGTNDPDSLVLTATVDGVTEEIAYIDNNYTEDKIPNIVKLNKDSDIAKLLLNTNDAELVEKNYRKEAFFYILIGGKAVICGDDNSEGFKVNLKWQSYPGPGEAWLDHFRADYIRPINLTKKAADNFVDAVDLGERGSFISIKSLVAPKDWRGREFGLNESDLYYEYWSYYGVFKITADIKGTTCDLNGEPGTKVPVTVDYDQVTKDQLLEKIKDPSAKMRDKDGNYVFGLPFLDGEWKMFFYTTIKDKKKTFRVGVDRQISPTPRYISPVEASLQMPTGANMFVHQEDEPVPDGEEFIPITQKNFVLENVTVKAKRRYFTNDDFKFKNENYARRWASVYYDIDRELDNIRDRGEEEPTIFEFLAKKNMMFKLIHLLQLLGYPQVDVKIVF